MNGYGYDDLPLDPPCGDLISHALIEWITSFIIIPKNPILALTPPGAIKVAQFSL